jgi:malate dehydrogenase (oxaloacetate-decarboxylating)
MGGFFQALSAMKIKGERITEQRFLIHGAGAGGVGIAEQLEIALIEEGLAPAEARGRIFTVDSVGLVTSDRSLQPYKLKFAKDPLQLRWLKSAGDDSLASIVRHEKITVLIGTSGQPGCFSKEIIDAMLANTEQPVILPLSNPTTKAEALPADLFSWSNGRALVATGSPFEPVDFLGKTVRIGQCNNVFIFPGVGLGVLASGARQVLPEFFIAAARAVSEQVSAADLQAGVLFPEIDTLREVSKQVAIAVGETAIRKGVSGLCVYSTFQHDNDVDRLAELIDKIRWQPVYLPLVPM